MTHPEQSDRRSELRRDSDLPAQLIWKDEAGNRHLEDCRIVDVSRRGMAIKCPVPIPALSHVVVRADAVDLAVLSTVRTCSWQRSVYRLGVHCPETASAASPGTSINGDHQEILRAASAHNPEALERIYRKLAKHYHPDNQQTGSAEEFLRLQEAYSIVSDPRRSQLSLVTDSAFGRGTAEDATAGDVTEILVNGEQQRMRILVLLFRRKAKNLHNAAVSPLEISAATKTSQEETDFALWYLQSKRAVVCGESSGYEITTEGIDLLERYTQSEPRAMKLLAARVA